MTKDEVLTQICAEAGSILSKVSPRDYSASRAAYNRIVHMARSLMTHKPPQGPRKYTYKPEARVE